MPRKKMKGKGKSGKIEKRKQAVHDQKIREEMVKKIHDERRKEELEKEKKKKEVWFRKFYRVATLPGKTWNLAKKAKKTWKSQNF